MADEFEKKEKAGSNNRPEEYYIYLFKKLVEYVESHLSMVNNLLNSTVFSSLLDILSQEIQRDIYIHLSEDNKQGISVPIGIPMIAAIIAGGTIQLIRYWLTNQDSVQKEDILNAYTVIMQVNFGSLAE